MGPNSAPGTIALDSGIESAKNGPSHAIGIVGRSETAAAITYARRTTGDCVGKTDAAGGRYILEGLCLPECVNKRRIRICNKELDGS